MISPGLVSVTLRRHAPSEIVALAAKCGLTAVEWGSDVHVPPGDIAVARDVARLTTAHGLKTAAYGSYYRAGAKNGHPFSAILETAKTLNAPVIRVWAGTIGSAKASAADWDRIAADLGTIADLAAVAGLRIAIEFHDHTLCDRADAALQLVKKVGRENLRTLWQPRHGISAAANGADLLRLLPLLEHVHVFHWWPDEHSRLPLTAGAESWRTYLTILKTAGRPLAALLEFVQGDSPDALQRDAATLHELLDAHA